LKGLARALVVVVTAALPAQYIAVPSAVAIAVLPAALNHPHTQPYVMNALVMQNVNPTIMNYL